MDLVVAVLVGLSTATGTAVVTIIVDDLYRRLTGSGWRHFGDRRRASAAPTMTVPIGVHGREDPILAVEVRQVRALQVGNGNVQHNVLR